jgi:hypothetical protein
MQVRGITKHNDDPLSCAFEKSRASICELAGIKLLSKSDRRDRGRKQ